jgi:multiple sugar transport system ATP-binding protein
MARVELINICKKFTPNIIRMANPLLLFSRFLNGRKMEADLTGNFRSSSFSIEHLSLSIPDGEVMVILGPSGCGKSTLLKMIAGLMQPDSGEIRYDGLNMENTPTEERNIGMVFQNYALYPHFTSKQNVLAYFFFRKKTPELDAAAKEKFKKTSELMGVDIEYLMDRKPTHLSAGEKQRIALARCITRDPSLFLMDEPFSNLDQKLREKYRVKLKTLLSHFNITTVYVTHDQQEALILADTLAVMNIGNIEQVGTPEEIYHNPKNIFVAEFLNLDLDTPAINLFDGKIISEDLKGMLVGARPEDIEVREEKNSMYITGSIVDIRHTPIKNITILQIDIEKNEIYVRIPLKKNLSVNDDIRLYCKRYHVFDRRSGIKVRTRPEK